MTVCFSDREPIISRNSIFLAGPTLRDGKLEDSWRNRALYTLCKLDFNGVVYIPEYEAGTFNSNNLEKQTRWEWKCLDSAGVIVFWIPRDMKDLPGLTTNIEFGRYITKSPEKVVLGYPEYAENMSYTELLYKELTGKKTYRTLDETLYEACNRLKMKEA